MPLATLDTTSALIVIDLQKGIVAADTAHPTNEIVSRSVQLARAFRERGLPVVLVNVTGGAPGRTDATRPKLSLPDDWADLIPALEQQPTDLLITKQRQGAFIGTSLDHDLRQRGVTQVFLTGIATSSGVESTARSAYELGYNVVLIADAMTDRSAEAHAHSVEKIFPRLSEVDTTASVLQRLQEEMPLR
ncbi:isochorismatase family protein [Granulicella sp. dw_53]|uniref:isochorismatase family protein n=1 Tax=Granulicella sp. dw_53 TaxID=2719792 RepID=UPI001BD25515|nr:isochorismatase family protein [Granulicella sp. dw_53]